VKGMTLTLSKKIILLVSTGIIFTLVVSYGLTQYLYGNFYVRNVEKMLIEQGKNIAREYKGGPMSSDFINKVKDYDRISQAEIFVTENPRELGACLPFDVDYQALITDEERNRLLMGESVTKQGYEPRFDRQVMAVIVPLLDQKQLNGVVYLYLPLSSIKDAFNEVRYILLFIGLLFINIALIVGKRLVNRITGPLRRMEHVARQLALGNFKEKVEVTSKDEIGSLGTALNHMATALEEVDQRRRDFLANVAHDLRTPLSYIKGYSEAIIEGVVTGEEQKKYLRLIHREAGRLQRLVHDLLDLAQLEGDSYPLKLMPLSLAQLVEDSMAKYEPFLREKNIAVTLDLDFDVIVNADEDRLEQAITNILDNALRHSHENGELKIILKQTNNTCTLTISDTGEGIPPEELQRLGERFYRVDKSRTRKGGGSGLGLSIVKQIVFLHKGTLQIDSVLGKGTDVSITLPIYEFNTDHE
jgi:signal transduction histidine kinase